MIEVSHPIQYSTFIEERIITQSSWKISNIVETMIVSANTNISDYFYYLFFPIFTESNLNERLEYKSCEIYLINHSKNKKNISLPCSKTSKIIYFVNNSNAELIINDDLIKLNDKKGKSFFIEKSDKINLIRASNIQTCMVFLNLKKKMTINY